MQLQRPPETISQFLNAVSLGKHRRGAGPRLKKIIAARELDLYGVVACYCCGSVISVNTATIEHIVQVSKGGRTVIDNLALSHKKCNEARGNMPTHRKLCPTEISNN